MRVCRLGWRPKRIRPHCVELKGNQRRDREQASRPDGFVFWRAERSLPRTKMRCRTRVVCPQHTWEITLRPGQKRLSEPNGPQIELLEGPTLLWPWWGPATNSNRITLRGPAPNYLEGTIELR